MVCQSWRPRGLSGCYAPMMIRLFGHYVSKLYLLLGVAEFLVLFYSLLAGFYMRFSLGDVSAVEAPETLSYTALVYAAAMTVSML